MCSSGDAHGTQRLTHLTSACHMGFCIQWRENAFLRQAGEISASHALKSYKVLTETAPLPSQDADVIPGGSGTGDKRVKADLMLYLEVSLSAKS